MANELLDAVRYAWRKYLNPLLEVPGTEHKPDKDDIAAFGQLLQTEMDLAKSMGVASVKGFDSEAAMNGDLAHDAGTIALVDGGSAFRKVGASGAGSWAAFEHPAVTAAADAATERTAAETARDAAEGFADDAEAAAAVFHAVPGTPDSGLLFEYRFDERTGNTVKNIASPGVYDLDLTTATDPNVEWTPRGVKMTAGLIQTDGAVTGVREIAVLYRVPYGATSGMIISAGNPGGGGTSQGLFVGAVQPGWTYYVANGSGIAPLLYHAPTGEAAVRLNRGGWLLVFMQMPAAYDTPVGWGGRADFTTLRADELEVAWSAGWSGALSDADREQAFLAVRALARQKGIYLHWEDCPQQVDAVRFLGQSGVTGYSLISEIESETTRNRTQPCDSVLISHMASSGGEWLTTEIFQFKTNQRGQAMGTSEITSKTGPMPGAAFAHQDARATRRRPLLICQSAQDSTSITINPSHYGDDRTWNAGTAVTGGMLWASMRHWWTIEQYLLSQGIGPRLRACWYFQGEEDGQSFSDTSDYDDNLQGLWDAEKLYMGAGPDYVMKLVKTPLLGRPPYGTANGMVAAKIDEVREGQVDFAGANDDVELIDCDDLGLDTFEHFDGEGNIVLGQRLYTATELT